MDDGGVTPPIGGPRRHYIKEGSCVGDVKDTSEANPTLAGGDRILRYMYRGLVGYADARVAHL